MFFRDLFFKKKNKKTKPVKEKKKPLQGIM